MIAELTRGAACALMLGAASGAGAQESNNRVAANTDWSVFEDTGPRECWAVSAPTQTANTRDGRAVEVRRGDILLMVFNRPEQNISGQIMFAGGYPFAGGSTVAVDISGTTFELFTEGESAWPATSEDDARIVAAMKRGAQAVVTGRSARGTTTRDTFSLQGFTAAVDEAARRCSANG